MSDQELKTIKRLTRAVWTCVVVLILAVPSFAFYLGTVEHRISTIEREEAEIKEAMINPVSWKYNDYFTRYLWAERWNQSLPEPPYNIRGAAPNL